MTVSNKLHYRTVWLSDIHLGYKDCRAHYLLDFLNSIECDTLYLVGDVVDLWALKRRFHWPSAHYDVIRAIFKKARHGTRVVYIPGNHDEPMRDYVGQHIGPVEIMEEAIHETADGRRLLLFHGDILDSHIRLSAFESWIGDAAYSFLLFLNRWANHLRQRFGLGYWSLSAYIKDRVRNAREVIRMFEEFAVAEAKRRGLDGVVCGHIHEPKMRFINGLVYCNDGDWVENCSALTETPEGELHLIHWTEKQTLLKDFDSSLPLFQADVIPLRKAG